MYFDGRPNEDTPSSGPKIQSQGVHITGGTPASHRRRPVSSTYGESGGLDEATSDIFGTLVEFYAHKPADAPDYLIGEKLGLADGKPLRYMDDPAKDGKSKSCWDKDVRAIDVHYSSGVGNWRITPCMEVLAALYLRHCSDLGQVLNIVLGLLEERAGEHPHLLAEAVIDELLSVASPPPA